MITDIIVFVIGIIGIFYLFLNLSAEHVKMNLKLAAALFTVSLLITFIAGFFHKNGGDLLGVILLQGGITSILFGLGYGVCVGLLMHWLKERVKSLFKPKAGDQTTTE